MNYELIHERIMNIKKVVGEDTMGDLIFTTEKRREVINEILKVMNIRTSLDTLYDNFVDGKKHKKIVGYNKWRQLNSSCANPWTLCSPLENPNQ